MVMPDTYRDALSGVARETVLRPFLGVQRGAAEREAGQQDIGRLRAERDSLASVLVGNAALQAENRQLRELLGLGDRLPYEFTPVEVLHIHGRGFDGGFLLTAGRSDGLESGAPIVASEGLVGMVRTTGARGSVGIDWTHPEFRASAMTADGGTYGMVEPRGTRAGEALLALTGTPFHSDLQPGTLVVTSGRAVYPRGIPIGRVIAVEEEDAGWRRSYLLEPMVSRAEMNHVLVLGVPAEETAGGNLAAAWGIRPEP